MSRRFVPTRQGDSNLHEPGNPFRRLPQHERSASTMKHTAAVLLALFIGESSSSLQARPPQILPTADSFRAADIIVILRPAASKVTSDKPDDDSFQTRPLENYRALETTCDVISILKGSLTEKTLKLVHFTAKRPEFNGGMFMWFPPSTNTFVTFPAKDGWNPDTTTMVYALAHRPEYLAFLRRLPDGRFAPAAPHYDAAGAFRLLSVPIGAHYHAYLRSAPDDTPKSR